MISSSQLADDSSLRKDRTKCLSGHSWTWVLLIMSWLRRVGLPIGSKSAYSISKKLLFFSLVSQRNLSINKIRSIQRTQTLPGLWHLTCELDLLTRSKMFRSFNKMLPCWKIWYSSIIIDTYSYPSSDISSPQKCLFSIRSTWLLFHEIICCTVWSY